MLMIYHPGRPVPAHLGPPSPRPPPPICARYARSRRGPRRRVRAQPLSIPCICVSTPPLPCRLHANDLPPRASRAGALRPTHSAPPASSLRSLRAQLSRSSPTSSRSTAEHLLYLCKYPPFSYLSHADALPVYHPKCPARAITEEDKQQELEGEEDGVLVYMAWSMRAHVLNSRINVFLIH
jgi:hypothetical protein